MSRRLISMLSVVATVLASAGATPHAAAARPAVRLLDLDNRAIDPFSASEGAKAIVLLFASVDCPISNRYAPTVQRLHASYAPQGVSFWMVYPNPSETADAIREHVKAFSYPVHVLRDPRHELVQLAKASVTPEAAVFDSAGALVYHGRIDDRYVSLGVERPAASEHDLDDALAAIVAGKPVRRAETQAVGCYIADFVR